VPGRWEASNVAAVADQITRDDRTNATDIGHRCVRSSDGRDDPRVEFDDCVVGAADFVEELAGDLFAFGADRVNGPDLAELARGPFRREILG
jgi:hypothetical protein